MIWQPHLQWGRKNKPTSQRSDRGDTLIEVLVTVVIVSIGFVALLTSLLTSTGSSTLHRGLANLDGILASFAESSRYQIQTQPEDGNIGPLFRPCATSYSLVSDPYPSSTPAGSPVALFVTGFSASKALSVKVGSTAVTPSSGSATDINGDSTIVFNAPASGGPITVSDGTNTGTSRIPFAVGATPQGITASTFQSYKVTSTVQAFPPGTNPCLTVTQQQVTINLANPDPRNASTDSISFVVGNFAPIPVVVSVSSTSQTVPATVTYAANVTDITGTPLTTGTVTWTFAAGTPGNPTCPNSNLAGGQPKCTINPTYGQQGTFSVTANYSNSGSTYPSGTSAESSYTLNKAVPTVNVTWSDGPSPGSLTFNAQVVGGGSVSPGASSPTMTWQLLAKAPGGGTSAPSCDTAPTPPTGPDSTTNATVYYTCTINSPTPLDNYTVSANYAGNTNYASDVGQEAWTVPQVAVSGVSNPHNGTIKVTVAVSGNNGDPTPTGTYQCNIMPVLHTIPSCGISPQNLTTGGATFTFSGVTGTQYTIQVTYSPDAASSTTYTSSVGSAQVTQ